MADNPTIELSLTFDGTDYTPSTQLVYQIASPQPLEAFVIVDGIRHSTRVEASLAELALRYRQKWVSSAKLRVDDTIYTDTNGDGVVELKADTPIPALMSTYELVRDALGLGADAGHTYEIESLHEAVSDLSGLRALEHAFTASCGATATLVHKLRTHSVLWASIPPRGRPNEVHRHLGGNVYCLFVRGSGHFHQVHPVRGFETLTIDISEHNPFHHIAIPNHLWYQPVNRGEGELAYFMIHQPAFDPSEMLVLEEEENREDWRFEH